MELTDLMEEYSTSKESEKDVQWDKFVTHFQIDYLDQLQKMETPSSFFWLGLSIFQTDSLRYDL